MDQVKFCPRCKRPAEAKDFMNPAYLGMLDSVMPQMSCRCGYVGLPLTMPQKEYLLMVKGSAGPGKR